MKLLHCARSLFASSIFGKHHETNHIFITQENMARCSRYLRSEIEKRAYHFSSLERRRLQTEGEVPITLKRYISQVFLPGSYIKDSVLLYISPYI